jgi:hypothetical protein
MPVTGTYADGMRVCQTTSSVEHQPQEHIQYALMHLPNAIQQSINYAPQQIYSEAPSSAPLVVMTPLVTEGTWKQNSTSTLTDALDELNKDHDAIGKVP